jgi:hypothetical protein
MIIISTKYVCITTCQPYKGLYKLLPVYLSAYPGQCRALLEAKIKSVYQGFEFFIPLRKEVGVLNKDKKTYLPYSKYYSS